MIITTPGALYKDVNKQDFNHYFSGTVMAFKLTDTKKRVFAVGSSDGSVINGSYLTREKDLKERNIPFKNWWDSLDTVIHRMLMFNTTTGSAIWNNKVNKNTKKSFPLNTNYVRFFGVTDHNDASMQNTLYNAFSELYGNLLVYPSLSTAIKDTSRTTVTKEGFLVDQKEKKITFYNTLVGEILPNNVFGLYKLGGSSIARLVKRCGLSSDEWVILDKDNYDKTPISMKDMPFISMNDPGAFPTGFTVFRLNESGTQHEWRTYSGKWPGAASCITGWSFYTSWGLQ